MVYKVEIIEISDRKDLAVVIQNKLNYGVKDPNTGDQYEVHDVQYGISHSGSNGHVTPTYTAMITLKKKMVNE